MRKILLIVALASIGLTANLAEAAVNPLQAVSKVRGLTAPKPIMVYGRYCRTTMFGVRMALMKIQPAGCTWVWLSLSSEELQRVDYTTAAGRVFSIIQIKRGGQEGYFAFDELNQTGER